jgi:tripartite-type tricarboxylate transporter receptor subunit TctC
MIEMVRGDKKMNRALPSQKSGGQMKNSAVILFLAIAANPAFAADFPSSPIRMIVPYEAGGASDVVARVVARNVGKEFGETLFVDNRPGGGALIGTGMVARAAPTGYTVGVVDSSFVINPALIGDRLPYDTIKDFKPVIMLAKMPFILAVNKNVSATSIKAFVDLARAKPGALNYSSAGNGSPLHLAAEQFKRAAGIDVTHVPYKGGAPSIAAIVAGQTQMTMTVLSTSIAYIRAGQLRALAVTGATRLPELPQVPTFIESGYPSVDSFVSFGVVAPAKTPDEVVNKLSSALNKALGTTDAKQQLAQLGFQAIGGSPAVYREIITTEIAKWIAFTREAHIKLD